MDLIRANLTCRALVSTVLRMQSWTRLGAAGAAATIALCFAGCEAVESPVALVEPEGFPKAFLDGAQWMYTRRYSPADDRSGLKSLEAPARVILQESLLAVQLTGDEWRRDERQVFAAAWRIDGHAPSAPCEYVETGVIQACPPWHQRSHFISEFSALRVLLSDADIRVVSEEFYENQRPIEVILEDGLLVVVQNHELTLASSPNDLSVAAVHHRLERVER